MEFRSLDGDEYRDAIIAWNELTPEIRLSHIAEHTTAKKQKRKEKEEEEEEQCRIEQAAKATCKGISNSSDRLVFVIV